MTQSEIDGKPIKSFVGLPHGAFAKMVREKVDPLYNREPDEKKVFRITVSYTLEQSINDIAVEAENMVEAKEKAIAIAKDRIGRYDDIWCKSVKELNT